MKAENHQNSFDSKIEIISINDKLSIHFIHVPEGFKISKLTLSDHRTEVIGRLNQFNRVKILKSWRKHNGDLVSFFKDALKQRGWDFNQFPNPIAYASYYLNDNI